MQAQATVENIEDLKVPFQCVAACIETASERWFTEGPLVDAVLASCSVPGILPPYRIGDEHFYDGGVVNSIPVNRAVQLGATEIYVLHVGRIERGLEAPRWPWEVGLVAFEIARRHRFFGDMAALPDDIDVHVMPTGQEEAPRFTDLSQFSTAIPRGSRGTSSVPTKPPRSIWPNRADARSAQDRQAAHPRPARRGRRARRS